MPQTKTKSYESQTQPSKNLTPEALAWNNAGEYVTSLRDEPSFIEYLIDSGIDENNLTSPDYALALASYTESVVSHNADLFGDTMAQQLLLVSQAPYYALTSRVINQYQHQRDNGRHLPEDEWNHFNQLKEQAVMYNQLLSNYMYGHEGEAFGTISQTIVETALEHAQGRDHSHISHTLYGALRGARTEAATRHLFEATGVPFRTASVREDLMGADLVIVIGDKEYSIDIKSSLDSLADAVGGYDALGDKLYAVHPATSKRPANILLYPGFTDNNLGDSLSLSPEFIADRAMASVIPIQLQRAITELNTAAK